MRRAAVQAIRTTRRPSLRKYLKSRLHTPHNDNAVISIRSLSSHRRREQRPVLLTSSALSSMYFRRFGLALVGSAGAISAFYAYQGQRDSSTNMQARAGKQALNSRDVYSTHPGATPSKATAEDAATAARRALVVGNGELYTGTITGDGPLSKETDDYGRKVLEMLDPDQVTAKLRRNEESYLVNRGKGVVRYDVVQLPSNDPIEDDHAEKIVEVPPSLVPSTTGEESSDWMFWGVFDGHSGWTTSAKLRQVLISFVARELNATYKASKTEGNALGLPSSAAIDEAIKTGFVRLDNEIVHESAAKVLKGASRTEAAEILAPALSGSCALLSFYDSSTQTLRVACTGDSRAVLGRRGTNNKGNWTAIPLSVDQTAGTPSEAARLRAEHPGEESSVVRNGRVLGGLEPSRAFGDSMYKWSREIQEKIKTSYFGRTPPGVLKSPPYVTAEPVVTTTKVMPERGDFVVLATDGLWEMLGNEEVVGLVGMWLDKQGSSLTSNAAGDSNAGNQSPSWLSSWFKQEKKGLPVEKNGAGDAEGQRAPIRQQQWGVKSGADERFVVEDKNVATHLIRNALGGKDKDMVCALMTLPSPYSRRYR